MRLKWGDRVKRIRQLGDIPLVNTSARLHTTARSTRKLRRLRANAVVLTLGLALMTGGISPAAAIVGADGVDAPCPTGPAVDPATDPYSMRNLELAIGADKYWAAGAYGQGVDVALIDTGVQAVKGLVTPPGTPAKVIHGPDLSFDASSDDLAHQDGFGHGTHMAGIIAGRDEEAVRPYVNDTTSFIGVAPEARIVSVKVGDGTGAVDVTQIIAGIDWVIAHARSDGLNIRVLNLSVGSPSTLPYWSDPIAYAAERAWKAGIVVVAAAGNDGKDTKALGITSPAFSPLLIAVARPTPTAPSPSPTTPWLSTRVARAARTCGCPTSRRPVRTCRACTSVARTPRKRSPTRRLWPRPPPTPPTRSGTRLSS